MPKKKLAILLTHGMGDITQDEFIERVEALSSSLSKKRRLGELHSQVLFKPIFFQNILQENQELVFKQLRDNSEIDWILLRRFMMYSFSDASSLEHRAHQPGSVYLETQKRVMSALLEVYEELEEESKNVIFLSHSLGCQVISNYIWDSQVESPKQGVWADGRPTELPAGKAVEDFARLKSLRAWITTGCNIPLFVAGRRPIQAVETRSKGYDFDWINYYDEDDILGWPMKPMGRFFDAEDLESPGSSYGEVITEEYEINANGSFLSWITKSWNPFAHGEYWKDNKVEKKLVEIIKNLIQ